MIKSPYIKGEGLDPVSKKVFSKIGERIDENNDDGLILCTGTPGTGKSSLMMWCMESYDPEGASVEEIGLNIAQHAQALKYAALKPNKKFCAFDEANVSRRNAMTKHNRDIIELYYSNRGDNMLHWWNNPSAEMLDKALIEERIKGIIIIATKSKTKPRLFYYFTKKTILDILETNRNLKHRTLMNNKEKAFYRGWFKKYDGKLWQPYLDKKEVHRNEVRDNYIEEYGTAMQLTQAVIAKRLKIANSTTQRYHNNLLEKGLIEEGKHFIVTGTGQRKYTEESIDLFKQHGKGRKTES